MPFNRAKKKRGGNRGRFRGNTMMYANTGEVYGQLYGRVVNTLGGCRFAVESIEGEKKQCSVCGKLKKTRIQIGDLVLMEPLNESRDSYIIQFKYNKTQEKILQKEGALKETKIEDMEENDDEPIFEGEEEEQEQNQKVLDEGAIDEI